MICYPIILKQADSCCITSLIDGITSCVKFDVVVGPFELSSNPNDFKDYNKVLLHETEYSKIILWAKIYEFEIK